MLESGKSSKEMRIFAVWFAKGRPQARFSKIAAEASNLLNRRECLQLQNNYAPGAKQKV